MSTENLEQQKELTALQELIRYCLQNTNKELLINSVGNRDVIPVETFYAKATELLAKEREQLKDSFISGRDLSDSAKKNIDLPRTLPSMQKFKFFDDYFTTHYKTQDNGK